MARSLCCGRSSQGGLAGGAQASVGAGLHRTSARADRGMSAWGARRSSVGGHDLTAMPFAALTDRSPADEGEKTPQSHRRKDRYSGLINHGAACCRSASLIGSGRRVWIQRRIGCAGDKPRSSDRGAAVVRLIAHRYGPWLRAQAEGGEEQKQAARKSNLGPDHAPSMDPSCRFCEARALIGTSGSRLSTFFGVSPARCLRAHQ